VAVAQQLKSKYGDNLCFYIVDLSDNKHGQQVLKAIAAMGKCNCIELGEELLRNEAAREKFLECSLYEWIEDEIVVFRSIYFNFNKYNNNEKTGLGTINREAAKKKADAEAEAKRQEEDAKKAAEEAKKAEDAEKKAAEEQAKQDAENVKKAAEAQSASSPAVEAKSAPVEETKSAPSSKVESHPAPTPGKAEPPVLVCKGTRLACPKCGNVMRNMFREVEDRGHVVMDYPLIYGKKYICGKCGSHFRKDE